MGVRRWRKRDRSSLLRLAKTAPDSDTGSASLTALRAPDALAAFDAHPTLVAADGEDITGVGTLWENEMHPARWRVSLFGCATFWQQEIATSLLTALRDLRPDPRRLQTVTSARNEALAAFLERHGFSLIMRTRQGVLPPGEIPAPVAKDLDDAREWIAREGIQIVPLAAFRNRPFSHSQLARLHADIYAQGHAWDPVRDLTGGEPAELFLDAAEMLPDAAFVALERKQLVGVSSLRGGRRAGVVELGWTGSILADPEQRKPLVHALLGASLRYAASANWRVAFEVNEADTDVWEMATRLPHDRELAWLTFAETGPDA